MCNRSDRAAEVAIAYSQKDAPGTSTGGDRGVTAEGWWKVQPGHCATVKHALNAAENWLYVRAESGPSNWEGRSMLCVSSRAFTLPQLFASRCAAGQRSVGFMRVDADKPNWTTNLR